MIHQQCAICVSDEWMRHGTIARKSLTLYDFLDFLERIENQWQIHDVDCECLLLSAKCVVGSQAL